MYENNAAYSKHDWPYVSLQSRSRLHTPRGAHQAYISHVNTRAAYLNHSAQPLFIARRMEY